MTEKNDDRAEKLLSFLVSRKNDRGVLADLRRGFSPALEHRAWPHLAHLCKLANDRDRVLHLTVAAAFALNPDSAGGGNMGTVCRDISGGNEGLKTFESRFRRLLVCDTVQELCPRLQGVIKAASVKGIPINHKVLFNDLRYWSQRVKLRWADSFWGGPQKSGE